MPSSRRAALAWLVLAVAVFCCYWWSFDVYFLGDDFAYVQRFERMRLAEWPRLFMREWSDGMWGTPLRELRPMAALSFILDGKAAHGRVPAYHLTNLVLHVVCSGMVMVIARAVLGGGWAVPLVAGLLFAAHPVHVEPVVWITGRPDLLAAAGLLVAFYALLRYREAGARRWVMVGWIAYGFGIFAKEFCLTLLLLAVFYDVMVSVPRPWRQRLLPYAGWGALSLVYWVCRSYALGPNRGAPALGIATSTFWRQLAQRELVYFGEIVPPVGRWLPTEAGEESRALVVLLALLVAALAALGAWAYRERAHSERRVASTVTFFAVVWVLATTLPFVVTYISARHLYVASAGACVGAVIAAARLFPRPAVFAAGAVVLIAWSAVGTYRDGARWRAAGMVSEGIVQALRRIGTEAKPGELLVLDVPATADGAWVWSWASPFALRPPFQARDLASDFLVLESEPVYFHPEAWARHPALPRVREYTGPGWLVFTSGTDVNAVRLTPDAVRISLALTRGSLGEPGSFRAFVQAIRGEVGR